MDPMTRAISRVRRRLTARRGLGALAWSLAAWAILGVIGLLLVRLSVVRDNAMVLSRPSTYAVAFVAAILGAVLWALWRRADAMAAAETIDRRLGLKDGFASALHCRERDAGPLGAVVEQQAMTAAAGVRPGAVVPITPGRAWLAAAVGVTIFAGLAAWLPGDLDPLGLAAKRERARQEQAQTQRTREQLAEVAVAIEQWRQNDAGAPDAEWEAARLALAELSQRDLSQASVRTEAAAAVSDVQQRLAAEVAQREQRVADLSDALRQLEAVEPGPADRFAQALQRGDFAAAAKAIDELVSTAGQLPAEQREAMQGQLEGLARQLQDLAADAEGREQLTREALSDAGLSDEQIEQLAREGFDPAAIERALGQLENGELTPEQREQIREQAQRLAQDARSGEDLQRLAEGIAQMADSEGGDAERAREIMRQMARMQQQLQQMRQADAELDDALDRLAGCQGQCPPGSACPRCRGRDEGRGEGQGRQGGLLGGTAEGGDPMGEHRQMSGVGSVAREDIQDGRGRIIASWLTPGGARRNDAQTQFQEVITDAQDSAERAMTDDRVPRRFHPTLREYFDQLPAAADEAAGGSTAGGGAPPAPQ